MSSNKRRTNAQRLRAERARQRNDNRIIDYIAHSEELESKQAGAGAGAGKELTKKPRKTNPIREILRRHREKQRLEVPAAAPAVKQNPYDRMLARLNRDIAARNKNQRP